MRKKYNDIKYIIGLLIALFTGIIGTIVVYKLIPNNVVTTNQNSNITLTEQDTISSAIGKINDAVVYIESFQRNVAAGSGTGFFYKKDENYGYIITNNHVVEGAQKVEVTVTNGSKYEAKILGTDVYSDIAVLQVSKDAAIAIAEIGESAESKVGDTIFTVGSPLGIEYMNSVTKGIISGKDRTVEVSLSNGDYFMEVIQFDAAINPGNSGGPLCNINGEVIGVNSLKLVEDEVEGMGFAIPMEYVMTIVPQLETGQEVKKPLIGIEMLSVGDTWQLYRNGIIIDENVEYGVVIVGVTKGKPADKAGLEKGDVVIEFAGKEVKSMAYFRYLLYKQSVGDSVKIKYYRDGKIKEATIILDESSN